MAGFKKRTSAADLAKIAKVAEDPNPIVPSRQPVMELVGQTPALTAIADTMLEVPLEKLHTNPFNARRVISQSALDELAATMKDRGQDVAVLAYTDATGKICLIDGHRRLRAAAIAGLKTLRVDMRPQPPDNKALYLASRQANNDREDQTPLDDALGWKMLLENGTYSTQVELAKDVNVSEAVMSRTLSIAEFPKTLINQLGERPSLMNLRMLDALKRYHVQAGDDATEAFILEVVKEDMSSRDVDNHRKSLSKTPVSRARSVVRAFKFDHGNSVIKRFAGQGRLSIEIKNVVKEEDVDSLYDEIEKLLSKHLGKPK